jgi:hypothetical protein
MKSNESVNDSNKILSMHYMKCREVDKYCLIFNKLFHKLQIDI